LGQGFSDCREYIVAHMNSFEHVLKELLSCMKKYNIKDAIIDINNRITELSKKP
jgi:hypothetical protein